MKKFDLSDCSIIVPFEFDSLQRLENLESLVRYFKLFFNDYEFIIVENGDELEKGKIDVTGFKHIIVEKMSIFSKSQMINIGVTHSTKPLLSVCDSDVLIDPKAIHDGISLLRNDSTKTFVIPDNGMSFNLKGPLRKFIMRTYAFNTIPFFKKDSNFRLDKPYINSINWDAKGGISLFRKEILMKLGGYNEEFKSWGYEDAEIILRYNKLGYPPCRLIDYNIFHLDHPRTEGTYVSSEFRKNKERLKMIKKMNREQLVKYIKTWSRFQQD